MAYAVTRVAVVHPNQNPTGLILGHDPMCDILRITLHKGCMICLASGIVLAIFGWVAYGWAIVAGILAFALGILASQHLSTLDKLRSDRCCCTPVMALRNMQTLNICTFASSIISVIAVILAFGTWKRSRHGYYLASGIFSLISSLATATVTGFMLPKFQLLNEMVALEFPPIMPVVATAQPQPMYGQPAYGQPQPQPYTYNQPQKHHGGAQPY